MGSNNKLEVGDVFNTGGLFIITSKNADTGVISLREPVQTPLAGAEGASHPIEFIGRNTDKNTQKYGVSLQNTFFKVMVTEARFADLSECSSDGVQLNNGLKAELDLTSVTFKPDVLEAA